jgi:uncharacterized phage protein (TIGR02216 family)
MIERTPWARLLAMAQKLCLAPAEFWRLSVREWRALVERHEDALTRELLRELMQRFPDGKR